MSEPIIQFEHITKQYHMGEVVIDALRGVDFTINKGEFAIVAGPSGAGKSTVLNILGGMDTPTDGHLLVDGQDISRFDRKQLIAYRRKAIGFVFQFYNLVPNLTALENVELAVEICDHPFSPRKVLEQVGLEDRMQNFPAQLSGGQQQRVAIARALAKNPTLLLCDEPTGALDSGTGRAVLKLLQDTCRRTGMTVVLITHNLAIAPMGDRLIHIKNGVVERMETNPHPKTVDEIAW
ncbi:ABC transporter ATP-binding protein [Ethanoligenens harbinense]|uniref:ABC transporter related protein n=1 Tax=Ethanoligenens harbinense (strain DSM 18485 / JCM 12961 / CGMCC 1.5033 / YUAN-3) TaxID=663278 RepID=E6U9H7_ETHHY|nr:ABC transporter ATP-binding protein [Ethanoligenens harbinense]ADU26168.1 ABC transporter related protein [Ethanoligenens harbinense YUAN-3]AVQ95306.1 ABC transporter ATP-binding protein [Ethanoligenens harbinense YUAN-3]AYF37970.1 ABC transporter ATP-binding protein [Ethanoligenens harbinense]AYF40717.1 ABC transporter ATP-binding protein [Ethanoligenens harbinense]QCN91550.1 ABC transporter ATP-binding protein [Ethanoligenens harbinense]